MLQATPLRVDTVLASGAVTLRRFVGFNGAQATVQGQKVLGVAEYGSAAGGDNIPVISKGSAIVEAGAALAAGQAVITDNEGRAIPNTGALGVGALSINAGATAVTSTGANGAIISGAVLSGSELPEFIVGDVLPGNEATEAGQFVEILLRR
jgi:hypothetical protein